MRSPFLALVIATSIVSAGCPTEAASPDAAAAIDDAAPPPVDAASADVGITAGTLTIGSDDRPAQLIVPPAHDGTTALPVLFVLHGYGVSGALQDAYFGASRIARERGLYVILPDGTADVSGRRFWNAGACCDFGATDVDDVAYLTSLLDEAEARVVVDTSRVYFMGHSNGAFMSYRMACELGDRITAVAGLAGTEATSEPCAPARPVSILHIHGTDDATILYDGGTIGGAAYRAAEDEVNVWRMRDACEDASEDGGTRDFDSAVSGSETAVTTWPTCGSGSVVELWRMEGSGHIPVIGASSGAASPAIFDWLLARRAS